MTVPFDGLAFVIILFLLDIETPKTSLLAGLKAIDWLGSITIVGGTIMFLLGLEYGGVSYPWTSATVICLIVFGLFTIFLFFINEWKIATYVGLLEALVIHLGKFYRLRSRDMSREPILTRLWKC